tara:strand:- start:108 stop:473 length:366 start_codon:yes stop_codon:yes gene_type:complete
MGYKIVVNNCYGGFGISFQATAYIFDNMSQEEKYEMRRGYGDEKTSEEWTIKDHIAYNIRHLPRHHKLLVEAVEKFGSAANGECSELQIVIIKGTEYIINEYDGFESVSEPSDIDWINIKY